MASSNSWCWTKRTWFRNLHTASNAHAILKRHPFSSRKRIFPLALRRNSGLSASGADKLKLRRVPWSSASVLLLPDSCPSRSCDEQSSQSFVWLSAQTKGFTDYSARGFKDGSSALVADRSSFACAERRSSAHFSSFL
jgi:hypothetical protein